MSKAASDAKTAKADETRARILSSAMDIFREKGYEKTTMRAISKQAGVSVGNAYYYFSSKEELVQGFYDRMCQDHKEACIPILQKSRTLKQRLIKVMQARQDTAAEYHQFAGVLFQTAANPSSPLNPFSDASLPTRQESIAIFEEVVEGAKEKFPKDLRAVLPEVLWLLQMGMVLYWVHDTSKDCEKSRKLIDRSCTMFCHLLNLIKLPPLKPLRTLALKTYREFRVGE